MRSAERERGSVAVEFVLTFGLLVLMMLLTLDVGRWLNANLVLTMAAREGARRAAIAGGDYPEVRERITELAKAGRLATDELQISIRPRRARYGTTVTVAVEYPFRPQTPVLSGMLGREVGLHAQVVTRSERLAARDP